MDFEDQARSRAEALAGVASELASAGEPWPALSAAISSRVATAESIAGEEPALVIDLRRLEKSMDISTLVSAVDTFTNSLGAALGQVGQSMAFLQSIEDMQLPAIELTGEPGDGFHPSVRGRDAQAFAALAARLEADGLWEAGDRARANAALAIFDAHHADSFGAAGTAGFMAAARQVARGRLSVLDRGFEPCGLSRAVTAILQECRLTRTPVPFPAA